MKGDSKEKQTAHQIRIYSDLQILHSIPIKFDVLCYHCSVWLVNKIQKANKKPHRAE